jgi:hypothetical protein
METNGMKRVQSQLPEYYVMNFRLNSKFLKLFFSVIGSLPYHNEFSDTLFNGELHPLSEFCTI